MLVIIQLLNTVVILSDVAWLELDRSGEPEERGQHGQQHPRVCVIQPGSSTWIMWENGAGTRAADVLFL